MTIDEDGGLGAEPPAAGGKGVWKQSPQLFDDFYNFLMKIENNTFKAYLGLNSA